MLNDQLNFVLLLREGYFLGGNLFELASYGKFGFLDQIGNKLVKGMCLARDREVFI